jgi:hypothetical protein
VLAFEDDAAPLILSLGLHRDGVMPVGESAVSFSLSNQDSVNGLLLDSRQVLLPSLAIRQCFNDTLWHHHHGLLAELILVHDAQIGNEPFLFLVQQVDLFR